MEELIEKEIIELEKEEFLGIAEYKADLSDERIKMRNKVRNRRRNEKFSQKGPYLSMADALIFRINKRIKELKSLTANSSTSKQEEKYYKEFEALCSALEEIDNASASKTKMQKVIIKYKNIA